MTERAVVRSTKKLVHPWGVSPFDFVFVSDTVFMSDAAPTNPRPDKEIFFEALDLATAEEEVQILRARVREAGPYLIAAAVKITQLIKWDMPQVRDKPGLRESIDLLTALTEDGVTLLTEDVIAAYLACLGKEQKELSNLRKALARLEDAANAPHPEIDPWVEAAFRVTDETVNSDMRMAQEVRP